MTNSKAGMVYEPTPINKSITGKALRVAITKQMQHLSTTRILWFLVVRHKIALLVISNLTTLAVFANYFINHGV